MKIIVYILLFIVSLLPFYSLSHDQRSGIAILWAYKNIEEARNHLNPRNKNIVGTWSIPSHGKWNFINIFGGASLNQSKAREFHLFEIESQITLIKESSVFTKRQTNLFLRKAQNKKQNISNFWYLLDVHYSKDINTLGEVSDLDDTVKKFMSE